MIAKLLEFLKEDVYDISSIIKDTKEKNDEYLALLGQKVVTEAQLDENSRAHIMTQLKEAMLLAKQVTEKKNFPFENASNVKYPLITLGTIQFAANVYPQVVANGKVVQAQVIGKDPDGTRADKAKRISEFMSYQCLTETTEWENSLDKLLHSWPIVGTIFKKIYYDPFTKKPCYHICSVDDVILNNNVKSLDTARRITYRFYLHINDVIERVRSKIFRDIEIEKLQPSYSQTQSVVTDVTGQPYTQQIQDDDALHEFYEQQRYMDLDDDGYQEPYIVTVHKNSQTVCRIIPQYDIKGIELISDGKVKRIKRKKCIVDYHFIPSPDGSYYSIGFGTLLTPLNKAINTLINQLIDSGTFANSQTGLLSSKLFDDNSDLKIQMGQLKKVKLPGGSSSLQDQVYMFPFKEPSSVLFQLLGVMMEVGDRLASITQIISGTNEVQNVPATTALETIRQGLKVFSSIQKRLYRSLKEEFDILYDLNKEYLDPVIYYKVLNDEFAIMQEDFNDENVNVKPIADPNISSSAEKMAKLNALAMSSQYFPGAVNVLEAAREYFEGLEFEKPEKFIIPPSTEPSLEEKELQIKAIEVAGKQEVDKANAQATLTSAQTKAKLADAKIVTDAAKIEKLKSEAFENMKQIQQRDRELDQREKELELKAKELEIKEKEITAMKEVKRASGTE